MKIFINKIFVIIMQLQKIQKFSTVKFDAIR